MILKLLKKVDRTIVCLIYDRLDSVTYHIGYSFIIFSESKNYKIMLLYYY